MGGRMTTSSTAAHPVRLTCRAPAEGRDSRAVLRILRGLGSHPREVAPGLYDGSVPTITYRYDMALVSYPPDGGDQHQRANSAITHPADGPSAS